MTRYWTCLPAGRCVYWGFGIGDLNAAATATAAAISFSNYIEKESFCEITMGQVILYICFKQPCL
jgi:hypothetical protein